MHLVRILPVGMGPAGVGVMAQAAGGGGGGWWGVPDVPAVGLEVDLGSALVWQYSQSLVVP